MASVVIKWVMRHRWWQGVGDAERKRRAFITELGCCGVLLQHSGSGVSELQGFAVSGLSAVSQFHLPSSFWASLSSGSRAFTCSEGPNGPTGSRVGREPAVGVETEDFGPQRCERLPGWRSKQQVPLRSNRNHRRPNESSAVYRRCLQTQNHSKSKHLRLHITVLCVCTNREALAQDFLQNSRFHRIHENTHPWSLS